MTIHREGTATIVITFVFLIALNLFIRYCSPELISNLLIAVSVIFFLFIVSFFRKPVRTVTVDDNCIYAPADGKVVVIEQTVENEFFKDKRLQISIFMSPLNVHINWFSISGLVKYYKYHPGDKMVAWHPKASELNERTTVVVENKIGKQVLMRQVAGALARRIVCYAGSDKQVKQGEELGFIKFGSRVDLYLPLDVKIDVNIDQKVTGNKTVIARFA